MHDVVYEAERVPCLLFDFHWCLAKVTDNSDGGTDDSENGAAGNVTLH